MSEIIARPVKYVRLDKTVIYLIPKCYGSFLDNDQNRDCRFCPVSRECEVKNQANKVPA